MGSIEIQIEKQKYLIKGDSGDSHLEEVAALVQERVDALQEEHPGLNATKVAVLAAVEFASQTVQGRKRLEDYRSQILTKAGDILDRIERELAPSGA